MTSCIVFCIFMAAEPARPVPCSPPLRFVSFCKISDFFRVSDFGFPPPFLDILTAPPRIPGHGHGSSRHPAHPPQVHRGHSIHLADRKSTRLNSSHIPLSRM